MPNRILISDAEMIDQLKSRLDEIYNSLKNYPRVKAGDPLQAVKYGLACERRRIKLKISKLKGFHLTLNEEIAIIKEAKKCAKCNSVIKLSIDHITPISKDGLHCKKNVQVLCGSCNSKKSNK